MQRNHKKWKAKIEVLMCRAAFSVYGVSGEINGGETSKDVEGMTWSGRRVMYGVSVWGVRCRVCGLELPIWCT